LVSRLVIALCLAVSLSGCVVHTAYDVAMVPVHAGGKVVDWTTTSRAEADRNYGRKMRKQQAREAKERRREEKREREQAARPAGY
jgi:hypothetical protein